MAKAKKVAEDQAAEIPEEANNVMQNEIASVTVQDISKEPKQKPWENPANVTFNVQYGKDHKGPKHMPEGPVVVSKETAEHFEKLGIGSIEK